MYVKHIKFYYTIKADSNIACRAHAVPLPCRAAKGLECVFPVWFKQCGRVWFTLAMPCCAVALRRTACSEHGMGMELQVWIIHGRTV